MSGLATRLFNERLRADWLPAFCIERGLSTPGFNGAGQNKRSECDAVDFIQARDMGLLTHSAGTFLSPMRQA